jgi:hypothetical protein
MLDLSSPFSLFGFVHVCTDMYREYKTENGVGLGRYFEE